MPVYFIQNEFGDVKIGFSKEPVKRLSELQSGTPGDLELIRVIDGERPTEKWLHDRFSDLHINREWFRFDPEMMTARPPEEPPEEPMTQAGYIIGKFGGLSPLAELLGHRNVTTVQHWTLSGYIPPRRYPEILEAARTAGIALKPEDFVRHLMDEWPAPSTEVETE